MERKFLLNVGDGHSLYCCSAGPEDAETATIFIHGGPGGHARSEQLKWVPENKLAVIYDQRGCGRSNPSNSLIENTTITSVLDIECIRNKVGASKINLIGGSWGSALALYYAIDFPDRVDGLFLFSPFLGSDEDVKYFLGASTVSNHKAWLAFSKIANSNNIEEIIEFYYRHTSNPSSTLHEEACERWVNHEITLSTNGVETVLHPYLKRNGLHLAYAPVSCHYFKHKFFMPDGYLIDNANKVRAKTVIVQGGKDLISKPETAKKLSSIIKNCELHYIEEAGHCGGGSENELMLEELIGGFV